MQSLQQTHTRVGTLDGTDAGRSRPALCLRAPRSNATGPFTTRQYLLLLVLRSRVEASLFAVDDRRAAIENHPSLPGVVS